MNKETHIYLADKIYENMVPNFSVDFPLDLFREANFKPDQSCQSIIHPHFASWSLDYIKNLTIELSQERLIAGEKVPSDFVVCLGRITHYLCDFFCHVHISRQLLRIREHIEYEFRLQHYLLMNRQHFDKICQMKLDRKAYSLTRMKQIYALCLNAYHQQPTGFERDMKAATWISVQVANSVINHCLQNDTLSLVRLRYAHIY